jgi:hypothetical protein
MLGAIAGDIIGSRFEGQPAPPPDFELFHPAAALLRFRRHCRCAESGGGPCVFRLVFHPGSGADSKYAGFRGKDLRNRDQGRSGLNAGPKVNRFHS